MIDLNAIEARANLPACAEVRDIAESQRDIPALVAEVRRLRAVIERAGDATDDVELCRVLAEASCPTTSTDS